MPSSPNTKIVYQAHRPWIRRRPHILVVACSDGRLQEEVDDFLQHHLHVTRYDRLYLPGGPGGLAYSGGELSRTVQHRRECRFLIRAHSVERVVLLFHGPSLDGPDEAMCADYTRKLPGFSAQQVRAQQDADVVELVRWRSEWAEQAQLQAFRCEINSADEVQFVAMTSLPRPEDYTGSLR